jgi:hypothetical protein
MIVQTYLTAGHSIAGRVVPFGLKISCPTNFPMLFSQILGGNKFAEYITSYSSIFVVVGMIFLTYYHVYKLK